MKGGGVVLMAIWMGTGLAAWAQEATPSESLQPRPEIKAPAYDPTGKRDPFRPFSLDLRVVTRPRELTTPLQQYDVGQLTVVGVLLGTSAPRAMVEDSNGMGYIVTVGTLVGRNEGVVKAIEPDRLIVEERVLDFYGQEQLSEVVMELPKEMGTKALGREVP